MAGTVMHLVIADKLLEALKIKNPAMFYCGNLAPDAVMSRDNYEREMKNHTHFKEGLKPYEFRIEANQKDYYKKLNEFVNAFLDIEDQDYELLLGYIVHILTDELYLLKYYEDYICELEANNIFPSDVDFSKKYVNDVDRIDWFLAESYEFRFAMPEILFSLSDYEIPGMISSEELEKSKKFIVHKNFDTTHIKENLEVQSYEKSMNFIDLCVEEIPKLLSSRYNIDFM